MEMKVALISTRNSMEYKGDTKYNKYIYDYHHDFSNYFFYSKYHKSLRNDAIKVFLILACYNNKYGLHFCEMGIIRQYDSFLDGINHECIPKYFDLPPINIP